MRGRRERLWLLNRSIEAAWAVGAGTARASLELPSGRLEGLHVTWALHECGGGARCWWPTAFGVGQPKF